MSIKTTRGNVTGVWCSRTMMEGWMMQRHCYMLRGGGMSMRMKIIFYLRVDIR